MLKSILRNWIFHEIKFTWYMYVGFWWSSLIQEQNSQCLQESVDFVLAVVVLSSFYDSSEMASVFIKCQRGSVWCYETTALNGLKEAGKTSQRESCLVKYKRWGGLRGRVRGSRKRLRGKTDQVSCSLSFQSLFYAFFAQKNYVINSIHYIYV